MLSKDAVTPVPLDEPVLASPVWYAALSLEERAAQPGAPPVPPTGSEQFARAAARAERWRRETHLTDDARFAARLAVDGITPEAFLAYLAEPPESLAARAGAPPAWLRQLAEDWREGVALPLPVAGAALGFLELVRPLLAAGWRRAADRLAGIAGPDGRPALPPADLAPQLLAPLLAHCRGLVYRAAILELQIARVEGRLAGDTPEARFASFVECLRDPGQALALLALYPLLARDVVEEVANWEESTAELAGHLAADLPDLAAALGCTPRELGPVDRLDFGLGDRHRRGRAVSRVGFGNGAQVVYKPRSLALDARFQELVVWLNGQGQEPALRTVWVLDRGTHGWMENVAVAPCADRAGLARFFRRQGALLALLHALDATDFHHENLIASGEHPVPVDLETLCHPLLSEADQPDSFVPIAETVLRVGLLPRPFWQDPQKGRLDLSGMGAAAGQVTDAQLVDGAGTDQMRVVTAAREVPVAPSRPTLAGTPVTPWEFRDEVLAGFRGMASQLAGRRAALLDPAGPLAGWPETPGRAIVRATALYVELLAPSRHPDFLRSGLDRSRLFDRLWFDTLDFPALARVAPAEIADLWRGDVPRFGAVLGSRDLWTAPEQGELAAGADRLPGFFPESGLDRVRRRLAGLDAAEVERQAWFAAAALDTLRPAEALQRLTRTDLPEATAAAGRERLLAAARAVGDRLAGLAVRSGSQVTWFHTASGRASGGRQVEPMGLDLYNGLAGMALFFAHLAARTGDDRHGEIARGALATVRRHLGRSPGSFRAAGAFNGWGGLLYVWVALGRLWQDGALLAEAREWARGLPAIAADDPECDLIGGLAGGLAGLLALHRAAPDPEVRTAAVACGDLLLARAERGERGMTWPSSAASTPLTGLGHGMAGIAWPLAELSAVSGEGRFLEAARGAVAYERSWFSPEKGWRDLRAAEEEAHACAWCHGAAGIGLARLAMRPFWSDAEMDGEIRAAVERVRSEGFGLNHSLCHGDLGNLDLLLQAARDLGDPALGQEAEFWAARILAGNERDGWICGTVAGAELPGLMVGLAGIGYGLLRCADPDTVPSVLTLATT